MAIEEERLSLSKHSRSFPILAINRCLSDSGFTLADVEHIALSIKPTHNALKKFGFALSNLKHSHAIYKHEVAHAFNRRKELMSWYRDSKLLGLTARIHHVEHHLAHVAGSFYVSPYEDAALLGIDGAGEWATTWMGSGKGTDVKCTSQSYFPHSLGSFYEAVTQYCGFKTNYDEGKTMGLAPLGNPDRFYNEISELVRISDNGEVNLDLSYFNFQNFSWNRFSPKFEKKFGLRREPGEEFSEIHMDMAAAFQKVLEENVLKMTEVLYQRTKCKNLVLAGGVALNSVLNGRIVRESNFDDLYVMPAAGDNGTSIGAAFYVYNKILEKPRNYIHLDPFIGTCYSDEDIEIVLIKAKAKYTVSNNVSKDTAKHLQDGKIVGWFQGPMEFGPRSLGGRSILANPAIKNMKDKINAEVKFREAYRPFAPSTTAEKYGIYFDSTVEAPFMLKVCQVRDEYIDQIPSVVHVDGSARLQTLRRNTNPLFYDLIEELGKLTGVSVVLNTSFNIQGQPIIESPTEALKCFYTTGLDVLVIGKYILEK